MAAAHWPEPTNSNNIHPIKKPSETLPTSPKKICDGGQLKNKNAIVAAETMDAGATISVGKDPVADKTMIPNVMHMVWTPVIPSIPSMKLYKFTNQTQQSPRPQMIIQLGICVVGTREIASILNNVINTQKN
tara:strand:- start:1326 stop:1721 length:396 start_codon:yes stop_codon:yes gene_type:complete